MGVTGFDKGCNGCHFCLEFASLGPRISVDGASVPLEIRGRTGVATRLQRGNNEKRHRKLYWEKLKLQLIINKLAIALNQTLFNYAEAYFYPAGQIVEEDQS